MPPIRLNRRSFLGYSAAAGIALAQGKVADASAASKIIRVGMIGLGNRGTALLRTILEIPDVEIVAIADSEEKHRVRAQGIAQKASKLSPELYDQPGKLLERSDVHAVISALPCDLHASNYRGVIDAGKHLYAEKPLALTIEQCDAVIAAAARAPSLVVHVGHQRRSNPRYIEGIGLARRGDLGDLIEARGSWSSSNGPVLGHGGWLGSRERSGDFMVEQAVHMWDVLHWIAGESPSRASGIGRRDAFARAYPRRDVTDWYAALLSWDSGFSATMRHSWVDPPDDAFTGMTQQVVGTSGGLDFSTGTATFRDRSRPRQTFHPGKLAGHPVRPASLRGSDPCRGTSRAAPELARGPRGGRHGPDGAPGHRREARGFPRGHCGRVPLRTIACGFRSVLTSSARSGMIGRDRRGAPPVD